jgi:hypothetical protein
MATHLDEVFEEFIRTYVTFRPVRCERHGDHLHWTFEPVIHDKPVPPPDMSMYLTGNGVQSEPLGTWRREP